MVIIDKSKVQQYFLYHNDESREHIPLLFVFNNKMKRFSGLMGTNKKEEKVLILHGSNLQY
ncbi:hypothetical protein H5410_030068 [Solanum commersonii]|uniref:Uncharacterized protein n=1 Tax=Solanum commersonii TaxID=4109 RepID=A0A9J5YEP4_SOLCO|nr:hypothetical protein H5410_030068 [Solanum commersonii]